MKRFSLGLGVVVAGLALGTAPAFAQRPSDSSSHGGGGGEHAVDRGSGGGGGGGGTATSSGSTSVATGSSGVSSSSPSAGAAASPSISRADFAFRESAPQHRGGSGGQHTASSGSRSGDHAASGGDRAVPRGESATPSSGARTSGDSPSRPSESNDRAIPSWARPRGDRPATDTAVARTTPRNRGGNGGYYDPYAYYGGYSFGGYYGYPYGYFAPYAYGGFYDPFYYDPFYFSPGFFGYGMSMGLGGYPYVDPTYGGDPYAYGASGGSYAQSRYQSHEQGNLKLKVKPRAAKVYVDGYYVGVVDEFDGAFQKLPLNAGRHHVKIEAEGYETAEFDANVVPEQTVTFQGQLKKIQ
jgi:PEGA domain-containing protein